MLMCVVLLLKFSSCCRDGAWASTEDIEGDQECSAKKWGEDKKCIIIKDIIMNMDELSKSA